MGLLHKVRILVGALVHKPFTPRPEREELEPSPRQAGAKGVRPDLRAQVTPGMEEDRVADLIAEKKADEATPAE